MQLIRGVTLTHHGVFSDARGDLMAFEPHKDVPFPAKRIFTIKVGSAPVARGGHANSCDELIVCLTGAVSVDVDNGEERASAPLSPTEAVWIGPGIVINLRNFAPETILLVFASALYGDTRHYDRPQPALSMTDCVA